MTNRFGAPPIDEPRDLRTKVKSPCTQLLDDRALETLGYGPRAEYRLVLSEAPECTWQGERPRRSASVAAWIGRDYFVDTYRNRVLPIFRPVVIEGLPAVERQSNRGRDVCTTTVGVAASQALEATVSVDDLDDRGEPIEDPCAEGRRVLEAVIAGLPPA